MSTRSRWRSDGKPIEFNGIKPDVEVEAVPEELQKGLNSTIRRAEEYLKDEHQEGGAPEASSGASEPEHATGEPGTTSA